MHPGPDTSVFLFTTTQVCITLRRKKQKTIYSPKSCMEHNPRTPHVVFRGREEAVFSQGHIADERQDEHGDAQDNQTQGLGDADHLGSVFIPCV